MYVWRTTSKDALLPPSAIVEIGTTEKTLVGVDWAGALAGSSGDTPLSSAVSIVTGSCELSATLGGTYAATANATNTGLRSTVAVKNAQAGPLQLLWLLTSTNGLIVPVVRTFNVVSR